MISGDYHIHSRYSGLCHGKNTLSELRDAATRKGLREIGIADHGLKHLFFGTDAKRLLKARREADALNAEQGARVLLGLEANLISEDGLIDCGDLSTLDFVAMGYHKLVAAPSAEQARRFTLPALFRSESKKDAFTRAYIKAIKRYPLSFVTHPGRDICLNVLEIAKAMSDYGVLFELNGKRVDVSDGELCDVVAKTAVKFIVNSDAHRAEKVGEVSVPLETAERVGLPLERIVNLNKPAILRKPFEEETKE